MLKRAMLWRALCLVLLLGLIGSLPKSAAAHAFLERSEPADNAILTESPEQFLLWFSEPLSPEFSSAQVLDTEGKVVVLESIQFSPENPRLMILGMPPDLPEGAYSVLWKVLSTADGHFTQGLVVFGIGPSANLGRAVSVEAETAVPLPEIGLRWLNFITLMGVVGALAVVGLVLDITNYPLILASIQSMARRRILRFALWLTVLSLFVGVGWLGWQAIAINKTLPEGTAVLATAWQWLSQTRLGLLWVAKQVVLLSIAASLYRYTKPALTSAWLKAALVILLVAVVTIQSLTSHAAALKEGSILAVIVDALHFFAASIWVGGLLATIVGFMPFFRTYKADHKLLLHAGWQPFGRVAVVAVFVLFATGLYSSGQQVASVDALISTGYGRVLSAKVVLMLLIGGIGFLNAMILHSGISSPIAKLLRRPEGWTFITLRHMPRLIYLEATLGLIVFILTGYITAAPTARGPQFVPSSEIATVQNQQVDDVLVNLSIKPNRPGANVFTIRATNTRRPPLAEIDRVIVRLTYQDQEFGMVSVDAEEVEPGIYRVGGNELNVAGNWEVSVVVRRLSLPDKVASFDWTVEANGAPQSEIISNEDWRPVLSASAVFVLLVMLVGIAIVVPRRMDSIRFLPSKEAKQVTLWQQPLQRE